MLEASYDISLVNRVLISKSFGSWDELTCLEFIEQYKSIASALTGQAWGGLIDVSQWQLATPDAEKLASKFELWCCEHNRQFVAIVGSSSLIDFQLKRSGLEASCDQVQVRAFTEFNDAVDWFKELGLWD